APGESASEQSVALHVNYFATRNIAPLRMYKASRFPADSCLTNVTMGSAERRPVVVDDRIVIGNVAPLFIRSDHRLVDMMQLSAFVSTLRRFLTQPAMMEEELPAPDPRAGTGGSAISRAA